MGVTILIIKGKNIIESYFCTVIDSGDLKLTKFVLLLNAKIFLKRDKNAR